MTDTEQPGGNFVSFTIDPITGQVVKVETLDPNGARHEVSDQEKTDLARGTGQRLEEALEHAFEAGIDCILGDEDERQETDDAKQDVELRHVLLAPLIQHSSVNRLLQREVLDRAILETLIQHSMKPSTTAPGGSPAGEVEPDRAAPTPAN